MDKSDSRYPRYFAVRAVSRIVDLAIYFGMIIFIGIHTLIYAFAISMVANYVIDFWGQKIWVFEQKLTKKELLREFSWYLFVRGTLGITVAGCFYIVNQVIKLPLLVSLAIIIFVVWPIAFQIYKKYIFKTGAS